MAGEEIYLLGHPDEMPMSEVGGDDVLAVVGRTWNSS